MRRPARAAGHALRHHELVQPPQSVIDTGSADVPDFTLADAHRLLDAQPFYRWWGLRLDDMTDGSATLTLPAAPHLLRPGGLMHGSCYEVVADVAMWLAIMTRTGEEPMAVTVEMKTSFLRGTSQDITGTARLLKLGRRMAFGEAEMHDGDGRLVAHSTLSYIRPDQP